MTCDLNAKHQLLGGDAGPLGPPTEAERPTPDGLGHFRLHRHGGLWCRDTFPHEPFAVWGLIHRKWAALGGTTSPLGWPRSDELAAGAQGRISHFERGAIVYRPDLGTFETHGAIHRRWLALGDLQGPGFPLTDELTTPDGRGRYNHFERSSIYWTPMTGAVEVSGEIKQAWARGGWERGPLGYPVAPPSRMPGSSTEFQDFERGSLYANGPNVVSVERPNASVVAFSEHAVNWAGFDRLLPDRDFIRLAHRTSFLPQFGSVLTLQLQAPLTWWKGLSLFSPSRGDFLMLTVDGNRRMAQARVMPAQLQGGPIFIRLHKAKFLGVHTPMYRLSRPDRLIGTDTRFTWISD